MLQPLTQSRPMLVLVALAAALVLHADATEQTNASKPPNVLFIVSDDLRPELGIYGGRALTPNIDALANRPGSMVFDRAYVQQAICCPSRSSFLTGRRPDTTKVWDLKTYWRQAGGNFTTLPEVFRNNGYWTVGMGKVFHPGFKDDAPYSWSEPYYHADDKGLSENMTRCFEAIPSPVEDDNLTDGMLAQHAAQVLQQASQRQEPFFVAVGFHRPHLPWDVPKKYFDMYPLDNISLADHNTPPKDFGPAQQYAWDPQSGPRHCGVLKKMSNPKDPQLPEFGLVPDDLARQFRQAYYASVSATDRNVGVVLDTLSKLGLDNNTIIVFIGDHGWQLGDLGEFGKKTNFERATRAPLVILDPRLGTRFPNMRRSADLVEFVDIMPTLMDLVGLDVPSTCPEVSQNVSLCTEGTSLKPVLEGSNATSKDAVFMQYAYCMHDDMIWHDACNNASEPRIMGYALRTRRWRYIEWVPIDKNTFPPTIHWDQQLGRELYDHTDHDIVENVAESINLAYNQSHAGTVQQLSDMLHSGWRGVI